MKNKKKFKFWILLHVFVGPFRLSLSPKDRGNLLTYIFTGSSLHTTKLEPHVSLNGSFDLTMAIVHFITVLTENGDHPTSKDYSYQGWFKLAP